MITLPKFRGSSSHLASCSRAVQRKLFVLLALCLLLSSCLQSLGRTADEGHGIDQASSAIVSTKSIRVITSGGFAAAYNLLEPVFEEQTGIDLQSYYGSSSGGAPDSIPVRLSNGEKFDVLIMSEDSLNRQIDLGRANADTQVDLVRSMIGMAVKKGVDKHDIGNIESFTAVLLSAESIAYSASASGRYLSTQLWPKMGIWSEIEGKSTRILSERVASVVARGDAEIGFQQVSEILGIAGVDYVGQIPDALQKVTTFSSAVTTSSANVSDAQRLLSFLSSIEANPTILKLGLQPVNLE